MFFSIATIEYHSHVVPQRPWNLIDVSRIILVWMACLFVGAIIIQSFPGIPNTAILLVNICTFHISALIILNYWLHSIGVTWEEAFGLRTGFNLKTLAAAAFAALCVIPISIAVIFVCEMLITHFGLEPQLQDPVLALAKSEHWHDIAIMGVMACILAPIVEELIFRGLIYQTIKQSGYKRSALWASSILFAAFHSNLMTFIPLTLLAILFALLYETSGTIVAPIAVHSLFNLFNFGMILVAKTQN